MDPVILKMILDAEVAGLMRAISSIHAINALSGDQIKAIGLKCVAFINAISSVLDLDETLGTGFVAAISSVQGFADYVSALIRNDELTFDEIKAIALHEDSLIRDLKSILGCDGKTAEEIFAE